MGEDNLVREEVLSAEGTGHDPEFAARFKNAIFENEGLS